MLNGGNLVFRIANRPQVELIAALRELCYTRRVELGEALHLGHHTQRLQEVGLVGESLAERHALGFHLILLGTVFVGTAV